MHHVVVIRIVQQTIENRLRVVRERISTPSKSSRVDIHSYKCFFSSSTPVISTVQPSCFKNLSIFQSNSPYIIQKMGELVCVDYARCSFSCFKRFI